MKKIIVLVMCIFAQYFTFGQVSIDTGRGGGNSNGKAEIIRDGSKTPPKVNRYNLLFLGDEYTDANSLIQLIQYMGVQVRRPFEIAPSKITPANCSLALHLSNTQLPKAFEDVKWNFVVLQENRTGIINNPDEAVANAKKLADMIKANGASPVLFMTWADKDKPEQSKEILKAYETMALQNKCRMSPVGIAWERAGKIAPDIKLFRDDTEISYPTVHGTYLTAACLFVTIFRQSPVGQKHTGFKSVSAKEALILQKIAYKTVMDYEKYIVNKAKKIQAEEGKK